MWMGRPFRHTAKLILRTNHFMVVFSDLVSLRAGMVGGERPNFSHFSEVRVAKKKSSQLMTIITLSFSLALFCHLFSS